MVVDDGKEQIARVERGGTIRQTQSEKEGEMLVYMWNILREAVMLFVNSWTASQSGDMNVQMKHRKTVTSPRRDAIPRKLRLALRV
jgi:hypothetical protein